MGRASAISSADAPAPPFGFPDDVRRALVDHNWRLRAVWNPVMYRWEIWNLRRGCAAHPTVLRHYFALGLDDRYWVIRKIVTASKAPREATWADYEILRMGDTQNMTPSEVVRDSNRPEMERAREYERNMEEISGEAAMDLHNGLHRERVSRGWMPEGARSW